MTNFIRSLAAGLMVMSFLVVTVGAEAAEKPYVMIMGEDSDRDTVPCNSRVFKRVLNAISTQLNVRDFDVYDETALTVDDYEQDRCRRTDQELIGIAKSLTRPPIDVLVIFSMYASAEELSYSKKIHARIEGRILSVHSGRKIANFEVVGPSNWTVSKDCPRECMLEKVGDKAKVLATDLGAILSLQLQSWQTGEANGDDAPVGDGEPNAFTLVFDNFCDDAIYDVEEHLAGFLGYVSHRPTGTSFCHHEYWYESHIDRARLNRNLRKMLDSLSIHGQVTFEGNTFKVEKIPL
jgi:hypothetical protein